MSSSRHDPLAWTTAALDDLAEQGLLRRLRTRQVADSTGDGLSAAQAPRAAAEAPTGISPARICLDGRWLISFGSNDYLGLASDERLGHAVAGAIGERGWGSGASPLVCGRAELHQQLEQRLATLEATEAALLFTSGFAANQSVVPALVDRQDVIFADALNHASLIDGCRLAHAPTLVYPHADLATLAHQLEAAHDARRRLIVTDSLFSMDGDLAPLPELAALADRYGAMLLVDEAHATGVFGAHGRGVAEYFGEAVERRVDIKIGTLSKALGSVGGFVAGRKSLIDYLANRARAYVFSTAMPEAACAAALAALQIVEDEPRRRVELLDRAARLRERLVAGGCQIGASQSQIVPVIVGSAQRAVAVSAALEAAGFFVPAIRPPSVPPQGSLLRISLSWAHSQAMIDALVEQLLAALAGDFGQRT